MNEFIRVSGATKDFVEDKKNVNSNLTDGTRWVVRKGERIDGKKNIYTITFFAISICVWNYYKKKDRDKDYKILEINKQLNRPEDEKNESFDSAIGLPLYA